MVLQRIVDLGAFKVDNQMHRQMISWLLMEYPIKTASKFQDGVMAYL